jgi:hypothetical protein
MRVSATSWLIRSSSAIICAMRMNGGRSWNSGFRGLVEQIPADARAQFQAEHLREVTALSSPQGVWLDVETVFAVGRKPE